MTGSCAIARSREGVRSTAARERVGPAFAIDCTHMPVLVSLVFVLQQTTGGATIGGRPDVPVTAEGIVGALNRAPAPLGRQIVQLDVSAPSDGATVWLARAGRHEHGYLVMLFAQAGDR
jgi:hypothetical protein